MGVDFAIDVELREPAPIEISEDEIAAHYRAQVPSGEPPLEAIREHVVRAIAMQRATGDRDPIEDLHTRFVDRFGRDRVWFDSTLEAIATAHGVTPLGAFQREPARDRWCDAAEGLATVRVLQEAIHERADLAHHAECLALIGEILGIAARERRRWRLLAFW